MQVTLLWEGVDRSGKSSFIEAFRKKHHFYRLSKMRVPCTLTEAVTWYEQFFVEVCNNEEALMYDRAHISEAVYAPMYRDYADETWLTALRKMERTFTVDRPVVIVYVYPTWLTLLKPDDRPNANLVRELEVYDEVLKQTSLPVIRISKHHPDHYGWRNEGDLLLQLEQQIDGLLGTTHTALSVGRD